MVEKLDPRIFKDPPKEFRGVPFYSVNDKLDPEEISRQIALLDEAGFGGVFFHAREGLVTPYLSEEWFRAFERALEEASKRGMSIWVYDEDRWPSGFASGLVPAEKRDYRPKSLIMFIDNKTFFGEETVAVFKCSRDENWLPKQCHRITEPESSSDYIYLSFIMNTASLGEAWFSGLSYVDLLDPDTVKRFIEVAYKPYVDRFSRYIGKVILGVFTDEPNIHDSRPRFPNWVKKIPIPPRGPRLPFYAIPWTTRFPEYFRKLNGYDIIEKLPELFFDIGDYAKTRYDYWRTVTRLFIESFSKQIYEWCDKHGLSFTGHYLEEDDLIRQLVVGSVMPHYEYMHVPGIDHLGLQIWGSMLTAKQVSSVANQLGRKRVLSETYGCVGFYGSFEDRKWIGDFLYALGINLLNHHLVLYSLRGRRKTDYGLIFHWSQPWWRYNRLVEDYFARLSYVLSLGERVVETLVIHPMSSVWSLYTPINERRAREVNEEYLKLLRAVLSAHVDFELGDEIIIEKHGSVEKNVFRIGRSSYKLVILPYATNLSSRTIDLLEKFVSSGGELIVYRRLPEHIDGLRRDLPREILEKTKIVSSLDELRKILSEKDFLVKISSSDSEGEILYQLRRVDNRYVLFITNVSREKSHEVTIRLKGFYSVEKWDLFTGEIEKISAKYSDNETIIDLVLDPVRSELLVYTPSDKSENSASTSKKNLVVLERIDLSGKWFVKRLDPNVYVIDKARIYLSEENRFSEPMFLPLIKDRYVINRISEKILLRYEFEIKTIPGKDLELMIEYTESIKKIYVNNNEIDPGKPIRLWKDPSFRIYKIPRDMLREGVNTVDIELISSLEPEIEPVYILGDFGVELVDNGKRAVIVPEKNSIEFGEKLNLVENGYVFYAGEILLSRDFAIDRDFSKAVLELDELDAVLAEIVINGQRLRPLMFSKRNSIDVTNYVVKGVNSIEIKLISSLRNMFGPLHREDPVWTGPETFYVIDDTWRESYVLRPLGFRGLRIVLYRETV